MRSSFQNHNLHQPVVSIHNPVAFFNHVFHFCKIKEDLEKFEETQIFDGPVRSPETLNREEEGKKDVDLQKDKDCCIIQRKASSERPRAPSSNIQRKKNKRETPFCVRVYRQLFTFSFFLFCTQKGNKKSSSNCLMLDFGECIKRIEKK